ncbi:magnesium transporter [Globomyces pollinis-pini]|nr:magnesium transporter [Globomyces pollinis-pini]
MSDYDQLEAEKYIGMALALASGILIGISFIITKRGLIESNQKQGGQAGEGYLFMQNPLWWAGTCTMILGETANFLAYSYAPAILVTPLGAISVMVGAILSHIFLNERLGKDGMIGCILCVLGSLIVILHAPEEDAIETVDDVWNHFIQPGFMIYMVSIVVISLYLIYHVGPVYGKTHMLVYISICSLVGSVSVMAVKGFAVAVKLTFGGDNQFRHFSSWLFGLTVVVCAMTQVNYFNKALDLFSTNRVTPIYYVFFTSATIVASIILSQGVKRSTPVEMLSVLVGFMTTFIGVFMVNDAKVQSHSLVESTTRVTNYQNEFGVRIRGTNEFVPLQDLEDKEHSLNSSDRDLEPMAQSKYQN